MNDADPQTTTTNFPIKQNITTTGPAQPQIITAGNAQPRIDASHVAAALGVETVEGTIQGNPGVIAMTAAPLIKIVAAEEFAINCVQLLSQLAEGEGYLLMHEGRPVARALPPIDQTVAIVKGK